MTSTCEVCGSDKIIPNVRVVDQGEYSDGNLSLVVLGNPDAVIFQDRHYGKITAHVCGECGHVELSVANPRALYQKYLKALEQ